MTEAWWKTDRTDTHCLRVNIEHEKITNGKPRKVLLLSDIHWDSSHCLRSQLKKVLDEALASQSPVCLFGDIFDAMQGKWDPRASSDTLREEHRGGNYLDLLVNTAIDWFKPYASILAIMSYGNHETSVKKRHEVDLLQRLVGGLRSIGSNVECGPYWGYILFRHSFAGNKRQKILTRLHYHHGYGGGGEVTRGLIDHSRTRGMYQSDIYVSGHIHRHNSDSNVIHRLTEHGKVEQAHQLFLRCSAWKDESGEGWHVEKGRAARPAGGWWLEFQPTKTQNDKNNYNISMRATST